MENSSNILPSSTPLDQDVIYEVGYKRISNRTIASILGCMGVCYLIVQSPIAAIGAGILSTMMFAEGAVGHASLLTPSKKIASHSGLSCPAKQRSTVFASAIDSQEKNPRIHIQIKATPSQIKTIESTRILLSTSCSHGSSRLLSKVGLPHASFPTSLSPTWTAFYLINQQKKDNNISVKYINWTPTQSKIEIKIASIIEASLATWAILVFSIELIDRIYPIRP